MMNLAQAMGWGKTLKERHSELIQLRNENSKRERRMWDSSKQDMVTEPVYDVKVLDSMITKLAIEIRKLDEAIKETNALTEIKSYTRDDSVLGILQ